MTTLGDRLRIARDKKGFTQVLVRERTNINNKTLSGYEKSVSEPDTKTLTLLADLYEVSYKWLITGKGSMTETTESDYNRRQEIINKIIMEFPDADLMFEDMKNMTAEDFEDVYDFIRFKMQKKK